MGTASANLGWEEPTATGAWWDTGASTIMAAARAIAQETATRLQETVCLGECRACFSLLKPVNLKNQLDLLGFLL